MTEIQKEFEDIFQKRYKEFYGYFYKRTRDEFLAEDIVQHAFARTWKYIVDGVKIDNLRAFIYQVGTWKYLSYVSKIKSRPPVSFDDALASGGPCVDPMEHYQTKFTYDKIIEAMKKLKPSYRELVEMHFVQGYDYGSMSEELNEPKHNVYMRTQSAVKKLLTLCGQEANTVT